MAVEDPRTLQVDLNQKISDEPLPVDESVATRIHTLLVTGFYGVEEVEMETGLPRR